MRPLKLSDRVGTQVIHVGRPDEANLTDAVRLAAGRILGEHHPGTVASVDPDHGVQVRFVGLEAEPVSHVIFPPDERGAVPGLVAVTPEEWVSACSLGWWAAFST